jgi:parvulin-like peptidyl-prolyl isomerase
LVVITIAFGIIYEQILKPNQAIATVNGEKISGKDFEELVRFNRFSLISSANQTYQFLQLLGDNTDLVSQLQQINAQLDSPALGEQVVQLMIDNLLIKQEAQKRGITISEKEIDEQFKYELSYFPSGTPTTTPTQISIATSTLNSIQMTAVAPTSTPQSTPTSISTDIIETPTPDNITTTPTQTLEPTLTPTLYTEEGYKNEYQNLVNLYNDAGVSENGLKYILYGRLYRQKLKDSVLSEMTIPRTEEQVWARHILVADTTAAEDIKNLLDSGENWCDLASQYSTDTSNKDNCGDLGWFPRGQMVSPFEEAAFGLEVGQISEPVVTDFGTHLIWVLGHEERPISDSAYQQEEERLFSEWLTELRNNSVIETFNNWQAIMPSEPTMPIEILQFLSQINTNTQAPVVTEQP